MSQVLDPAADRPGEAIAASPTLAGRRQILLLDWGIVAVLLLVLAPVTPAITDPGSTYAPPILDLEWSWREAWWAWALQLGLVLPLVWRRRQPLGVFLLTAAVAYVQWLAGPELYGDLAVLIALYTVVAYERRRRALMGVGIVAVAGLALAIERWAFGASAAGLTAMVLTLMVAVPTTLGLITRHRNRMLVTAREVAVREERARLASEMHDVLAHNLAVMVALSDGARFAIDAEPAAARDALGQIGRTGRAGLDEMRRLLGALHDPGDTAPLAPQPGLDQLEALAARVRASGLEVDLHLDAELAPQVPAGIALAVHRIVQEAVTNVLRHAPHATRIGVLVGRTGARVLTRIENDGGPTAAGIGGGAGLPGMAQRAALLGGTFSAGASPDGWVVEASLPLSDPGERLAS